MTDLRSPWGKLRRNPAVAVAAGLLLVAALAAIFGPSLLPASAGEVTRNSFLPPSSQHFCGTDLNGRDLLYRVLLGAQISLLVGVTGALISFAVGIVYGMVAGYVGGQADSIMMRLGGPVYGISRFLF